MRGSVVIEVDDHAQAIDAVDGGHATILPKPKRLRYPIAG
jgi:hypothetical protein